MDHDWFAVQAYDDRSGDRQGAVFIAYNGPKFRAGQFIIVECISTKTFLGMVSGPQLNLCRNALGPTDNTTLNQLERILDGRFRREMAVDEVHHYEILLLKDITGGAAQSVRVRPQIASKARAASDEEIVKYLGLAPYREETRIGSIIDTSVPLCVSISVLMSHVLVAGSSGSGKTNTIANVVSAVVGRGGCAIVFDHKPDYQHAHLPNDDAPKQDHYNGLSCVSYHYIGSELHLDRPETRISIRACELDPDMLASTVFHRDGDENQREVFESLILHYDAENDGDWTIHGLKNWICKLTADQAPGKPHKGTFSSLQNKLQRASRIPKWIDSATSSQLFGSEPFDVKRLIGPGRTIVVRIGSDVSDGREYGLLLSYILNKIYALAESNSMPCPVTNVIDEAQDIFCASRSFRDVTESMLDRHIRKGRSKRIGFVIGVQSADAVPPRVLNNLNSRIIHRHNSYEQVRVAANMATEDQRRMTARFGPGEALAYIVGANSVVHAQMRTSPFKLTKEAVVE